MYSNANAYSRAFYKNIWSSTFSDNIHVITCWIRVLLAISPNYVHKRFHYRLLILCFIWLALKHRIEATQTVFHKKITISWMRIHNNLARDALFLGFCKVIGMHPRNFFQFYVQNGAFWCISEVKFEIINWLDLEGFF